MHKILFLSASFIMMLPVQAFAQASAPAAAVATTPVAAATVDTDLAQRMALATQMTDLTPPHTAVDTVIGRIVENAPANQRAMVQKSMTDAFDYKAFRDFVIKTMADSFTTAELKKMVEYHSTPEAGSIASKMPAYEAKIQPQMTKMLDVALMVARTGKPPEMGPGAK